MASTTNKRVVLIMDTKQADYMRKLLITESHRIPAGTAQEQRINLIMLGKVEGAQELTDLIYREP